MKEGRRLQKWKARLYRSINITVYIFAEESSRQHYRLVQATALESSVC